MDKIVRVFCLALYYYFLRYLPGRNAPGGYWFTKMRSTVCQRLFKKCGKDFNVYRRAHFGKGDKISIGDRSDIGQNSFLVGTVNIGNDVGMAFDVFISTMNREFTNTDRTILADGCRPEKPVTIHDDVAIFARSAILAGVTIGSHTVIGFGSVITRDIPEWSIVAGNPARIVKFRKPLSEIDYNPKTMTPLSEKLAEKWREEAERRKRANLRPIEDHPVAQ